MYEVIIAHMFRISIPNFFTKERFWSVVKKENKSGFTTRVSELLSVYISPSGRVALCLWRWSECIDTAHQTQAGKYKRNE